MFVLGNAIGSGFGGYEGWVDGVVILNRGEY